MATIVNNPPAQSDDSGSGFLLGVILLLVFAIIFFVYGLPYLRGSFGGSQLNVPSKIDINVQNPK